MKAINDEIASVRIHQNCKIINDNAFYRCMNLEDVTFDSGSNHTSIKMHAFYYCASLSSITLPSTLSFMGTEAFYYCVSLETIKYNGSKDNWNSIYFEYRGPNNDTSWHYNTPAEVVRCSNGNIDL